jgi:uncharacterized membrane protein
VKIIGIKVDSTDQADFVVESLRLAMEAKRVTLEDVAVVVKDDEGKVHIHQTKDVTVGKGAKRGTLVGAIVGLAAPPLLGAAAVGAGIGALWGKFRDRGIDDKQMKNIGEMIAAGQAVVFALGDDASIEAIGERVKELTKGDMQTFTIDPDNEAIVREAAVDVPEPTQLPQRMPFS